MRSGVVVVPDVLGEDAPCGSALAREVADCGIRRYGDGGSEWPCGSGAGEHPGLMLGLAGIGDFYLRLSAGDTPALLLPDVGALGSQAGMGVQCPLTQGE